MMPLGNRSRRLALLGGKLLVLVLLLVSPRALLKPIEIVHKSQDTKRPKTPKNVVRAEPTRVPTAEKQGHHPSPPGAAENVADFDADCATVQVLPRKAYRELTKPDYLKTYLAGSPHSPHSPPA